MSTLPTIDFFGHQVSRLICGGNPLSGISHVSAELDWEMTEYYTMPNLMRLLGDCQAQGINTFQSRGDRHQMRMYLEHRQAGGRMHWIAQSASEFADIPANIRQIARFKPIAIYHHGTHTDNSWHTGRIDAVRDLIKLIKDLGLPAGLGSHIPEVVEYAEEHGWETDFYMCCFYNLARGYKTAPAVEQDAYARDRFNAEDPPRMAAVMRQVAKPCLGFKFLAASRNCATPQATRAAFQFALANIKPTDALVAGMFPKHRDQVRENAAIMRAALRELAPGRRRVQARPLTAGMTSNIARPRQDAAHFMWAGVPTLSFGTGGAPPLPYATYHTTKDALDLITPEIMEDISQLLFAAVLEMSRAEALDFRK